MRHLVISLLFATLLLPCNAQINTDKVMANARNALYFEDYILSIQYFNQVIRVKPHMAEPYFFRAVAKLSLDDFKGAEEDCDLALERNPYIVDAYMCRGIARQNMNNFDGAISDYRKGMKYAPENKTFLTNVAICYMAEKKYDEAEASYSTLLRVYPSFATGYLARGGMYLEKGDTLKALSDLDKTLSLEKYNSRAYAMRGYLKFQRKQYQEALTDLNEAVKLEPNVTAYVLNRAIVRYHLNDLRGTMTDYDRAITLEPSNITALYNRGLLRMQVGDNNRAIDDFSKVLKLEPDNYFAYYNRAILHSEVGRYWNAVDDLTAVLAQYPQFVPAYYMRSEAKKKLNDKDGAERDYWTALNIEKEYKENRNKPSLTAPTTSPSDTTSVADESKDENKTREKDDKNINKFNRLLMAEADKPSTKSQYQNDIRGRVQDRSVNIDLQPMYLLTYYERGERVNQNVMYLKNVADFNKKGFLSRELKLTNAQAALTEDQIARHFASIDEYAKELDRGSINAMAYFGRSIDFMLVQDYAAAIEDLNRSINIDQQNTLAIFNRGVLRYKQLEYQQSANKEQSDYIPTSTLNLSSAFKSSKKSPQRGIDPKLNATKSENRLEYEKVMKDFDRVIALYPQNFFAYYNRANLRCAQSDYRGAIVDYTDALKLEPEFADAYYNRGLVYVYLGDTSRGIIDLSKAGELGIVEAYSLIKRLAD